MMNSMSGVRIAGDNRLCHARAGIVTNEAMMMTARIPRAAAIGRIPGGGRSIVATVRPNRPQWEILLIFST
jgi:hypothetical protein